MNTYEHESIFPGARGWQIFDNADIIKAMKEMESHIDSYWDESDEQKEKEKNKFEPKHIWPGYENS